MNPARARCIPISGALNYSPRNGGWLPPESRLGLAKKLLNRSSTGMGFPSLTVAIFQVEARAARL